GPPLAVRARPLHYTSGGHDSGIAGSVHRDDENLAAFLLDARGESVGLGLDRGLAGKPPAETAGRLMHLVANRLDERYELLGCTRRHLRVGTGLAGLLERLLCLRQTIRGGDHLHAAAAGPGVDGVLRLRLCGRGRAGLIALRAERWAREHQRRE